MTPKQFQKYLDRDLGRCWHCGTTDATLVPQHRLGRGMGNGNRVKADSPANIIVFCSLANGQVEADARFAEAARLNGWKLSSWQTPADAPVFDYTTQTWFALADDFTRSPVAVLGHPLDGFEPTA